VTEQLGVGSIGSVSKAVHKKTKKIYAIKEIKKSVLDTKKLLEHSLTEVKVMYSLNHPNIIKIYNHFEDEVSIFLVLEYAAQGQLYNLLSREPQHRFSESVAAQYIRQITEAVKHIHSREIMHRDLKLENILVDEHNYMKIADFGWSNYIDVGKRTTYCGTVDYLAP
jgi:serine/threonine protein kinase